MHQLMSRGLWMLKLLLDYYALTRSWFRLWLLIMKSDHPTLQAISDLLANEPVIFPMWMLFEAIGKIPVSESI